MRPDQAIDEKRPTAREVLAANVRRLIDAAKESRPEIASILKVAEESKRLSHGSSLLSKSRVGRIVKGSHPTDVDALSDLAKVFKIEPWQLLVEGLNPKELPTLSTTPVLEQIRALVAARPPESSGQAEGTFLGVTPTQQLPPTTTRLEGGEPPSLKAAMVKHKGGQNAKGGTAKTVSKSRGDRNTAGNARTRRKG